MAKTKDYEDYIDYTYDAGYDPSDFDSYDDYVEAILKKMPPINYNLWDRDSKKLLQSELTQFFVDKTTDVYPDVEAKEGAIKEAEAKVKTDREWRAKSVDKSMRWQSKRMHGKVSPTTKKTIKSIKSKTIEGKKLNKTERKLKRSTQMSRSWELQKKFGYSRSESMKKASKEYRS